MNRIKNNCSIQVEWMKENYMEFVKNAPQDHQNSNLSAQYNQQVGIFIHNDKLTCDSLFLIILKLF